MKKVIIIFAITLTLVLVACTRTYPGGATQQIGFWDATLDMIGGLPPRKEKDLIKIKEKTGDEAKDKLIEKENEEIKKQNEVIAKHNEGAKKDREDPDEGFLYVLGGLLSLAGMGWGKEFLNKRNIEKLRVGTNEQLTIANTRYQAIKEGLRDNPAMIDKVKILAAQGQKLAEDQMKYLAKHTDDIAHFKKIIKASLEKS